MTINCKGTLVDLSTPAVMGILNITPDSFYDGGSYKSDADVLTRVAVMLEQGATFIDVGGYSSKPGADFVDESSELKRILPIVELILREFPDTFLSIDTFRSRVASDCIEHGAAMVNDISAGLADDKMLATIARYQVPYVMMHMRGTPQTMQQYTEYDDLLVDVLFYFSQRLELARSLGINDVIIDPGFGFSKTTAQNYEILGKLELFANLGLPLLAGVSRKSMVYKLLNTTPAESLNGTSVLNTVALFKGANILRVHDVREAAECIKIMAMMR